MAKMTRSKLKGIVKECLVEILAEGLNSDESKLSKTNDLQNKSRREEERRLAEHRKKFEYKVEDTVSSITDDPIMASILKDTATTTLQEQNESKNNSGLISPTQDDGVNLDGIFGNASENWAKLAFKSK